jgi:hypothetical protein
MALLDLSPTYKSKVVVDSSRHGDLVSDVGANWLREFYTNGVLLHSYDFACKRLRSYIDHENLSGFQGTDLVGSLFSFDCTLGLGFDSEKSLQKEVGDIDLTENLWHLVWVSNDLSDERVRSSDEWINLHTDSDKSSGHSIHQLVVICFQRGNLRLDFSPLDNSGFLISGDEAWSNGDFISDLEDSLENSSSSNSSFKVLSIFSWLVYIEGSDDDHLWW